jgi:hypothetical protein
MYLSTFNRSKKNTYISSSGKHRKVYGRNKAGDHIFMLKSNIKYLGKITDFM